jgi:hypothetical protein
LDGYTTLTQNATVILIPHEKVYMYGGGDLELVREYHKVAIIKELDNIDASRIYIAVVPSKNVEQLEHTIALV